MSIRSWMPKSSHQERNRRQLFCRPGLCGRGYGTPGPGGSGLRRRHGQPGPAVHGAVPGLGHQGSRRRDDGGSEARSLAVLPGVMSVSRAREQQELLKDTRRHGLTAYRRFRNLISSSTRRLQQESVALREAYTKIQTHLKLLNEDINKFNLSYDFGLIAAQDGGPGRRPGRIHVRGPDGPGAGGTLHPYALQAPEVDRRAIAAGAGPVAPGGDQGAAHRPAGPDISP